MATSSRKRIIPPISGRSIGQRFVIHGDDDQIVPIVASGEKTARTVKGAEHKVYKGGSHGLAQVDPETFNADLLAFLRS